MLLQLIQEPKFPLSRVDEGIAKSSVVGKRPWPEEVSEVPLPPKRPAPAVALDADMMEEGGQGGGKINRPVSPRFSTAMSPRYPPV